MKSNSNSRRSFIKKAAFGSLAAVSIPSILSSCASEINGPKIDLLADFKILFQGDSITDSGRNKEIDGFNNAWVLGNGYPYLAAAKMLHDYAGLNLSIYNKGISGNKVFQLAERWDKDCLEIKPDILSILIGVNDIWHKLDGNYDGTVDVYKKDFVALLERTKKALPDVKLIICEPFAVKGVRAVDDRWYPEFYDYQSAAREIASQFDAIFIPYQSIYDEAQKHAPGSYWTFDGVHPSLAGAQLMAEAWLSVVGQ